MRAAGGAIFTVACVFTDAVLCRGALPIIRRCLAWLSPSSPRPALSRSRSTALPSRRDTSTLGATTATRYDVHVAWLHVRSSWCCFMRLSESGFRFVHQLDALCAVLLCPPPMYPRQLTGRLILNRTCWAGIGLSGNGTMGDATGFIIGQVPVDSDASGKPTVGLYHVASAPYGHAPPVVRCPAAYTQLFYRRTAAWLALRDSRLRRARPAAWDRWSGHPHWFFCVYLVVVAGGCRGHRWRMVATLGSICLCFASYCCVSLPSSGVGGGLGVDRDVADVCSCDCDRVCWCIWAT